MRFIPLVCCLLLVTAGCQNGAPESTIETQTVHTTTVQATATTQTSTSSTTTLQRDIDVEGGTLPYDPNTVWLRVETILGADVGAPLTIKIENFSMTDIEPTRFQQLLGVSSKRAKLAGVTPYAASGSRIRLNKALLESRYALEGTLAHEYVHVVQMRKSVLESMTNKFEQPLSRDKFAVIKAIEEGSAHHVEMQYREQFMQNTSTSLRAQYRNSDTMAKQFLARYYFGARYVNATVDSPENLQQIYDNPPRTTEELIHTLEPGSEPPAPLSVNTTRDASIRGPLGELQVRTLFGTALNESEAATLADGWGNDRHLTFGSGETRNYAWVHRWDDAANATEFEQGVAVYLENQGDLNASVRVDRVAPETTVLFVGDESFAADATASGTNETVTVSA